MTQASEQSTKRCGRAARRAVSLLEMLAVVAVLGVLSVVAVTRYRDTCDESLKNACYVNCRDIETQARLWYRDRGSWPVTNLRDVGSVPEYFPEGLPTCPINGSAYSFDAATQRVVGHDH